MDTKLILLLVFMGIVLIGIISAVVIAFIFAIRKRTIVHIIHPNNYITKHIFNGAMPKSFVVKNKTYIYDNNCEFRKGYRHYIYYYYNKTYPVEFDKASMTITAGEYNSTEVASILKTDLINKLLDNAKRQDIIMYMLISVIVLLVGVGVVAVLTLTKTNPLSPEMGQFIQQNVRIALTGV